MLFLLQNERFTATVASQGAQLCSLNEKKDGRAYLWYGDTKVWYEHSPLLFPVVGRLTDDQYKYNGKTYKMPKHGFLKNEEFTVKAQSDTSITLLFTNWEKYYDCFPFRYEVEVTHTLSETGVAISHTVRNLDEGAMYFSFGAHPGINRKGGYLEFEKEETLTAHVFDKNAYIDDRTVPFLDNGKVFDLPENIFAHGPYILENYKSSYVDVHTGIDDKVVRVSFPGVPFLGLWAMNNAPYVCIEPWYGIDDDHHQTGNIEDKKGIVKLAGKDTFNFSIAIDVL